MRSSQGTVKAYGLSSRSLTTEVLHSTGFALEPGDNTKVVFILVDGAFAQFALTEMLRDVTDMLTGRSDALQSCLQRGAGAVARAKGQERSLLDLGKRPGWWWNPTTALVAFLSEGVITCKWVGHCRILLFRNGLLVADNIPFLSGVPLLEMDASTADLARDTLSKDLSPEVSVDELSSPWRICQGDTVLLCSGILMELVGLDQLKKLVADKSFEALGDAILNCALARAGEYCTASVVIASVGCQDQG